MRSRIPDLAAVGLLAVVVGCVSTRPPEVSGTPVSGEVLARLQRDLPGPMAALYRLRVPSSGGLRLAVIATPERGQMSVSEPFGSQLSLSTWEAGRTTIYDLDAGCRLDGAGLDAVVGTPVLPLAEAARLLGGRLPAVPGDRVRPSADGTVVIVGPDWIARTWLAEEPARVVRVENGGGGEFWSAELSRHTLDVPGFVRFEFGDEEWAELDLIGLQWDEITEFPKAPDLPRCEVR